MAGRKANLKDKKNQNKIRQYMEKYKSMGLTIFTLITGSKRPLGVWTEWADITKEKAEPIIKTSAKSCNIAIRLGDDLAVIDIDKPDISEEFFKEYLKDKPMPHSAVAVRGNKRTYEEVYRFATKGHIYFRKPKWLQHPIKKEKVCGLEIRTGRQYMVAPNSYLEKDSDGNPIKDGNWYRWINPEMLDDLPEFPKEFYDYVVERIRESGQSPFNEDKGKRRFTGCGHNKQSIADDGTIFEKTPQFQAFLHEVSHGVDLEMIASILGYDKRREGYMCPNGHDTNSPSMKIWRKNNIFKCFGCDESYGAIGAFMKAGYKFLDACEEISRISGIPMPPPGQRFNIVKQNETTDTDGDIHIQEEYKDVPKEKEGEIEHDITLEFNNLLPPIPKPSNDNVYETLCSTFDSFDEQNPKKLVTLAVQGSGKSYGSAMFAIKRYLEGKTTFYFTRSHDEIDQWLNTVKKLLTEKGFECGKLVHLSGKQATESGQIKDTGAGKALPENGPAIIASPYAYLDTQGQTPYMYPVMAAIKENRYGKDTLVMIDEMSSYINGCFVSLMLGGRYATEDLHGYVQEKRNNSCPFALKFGNCSNCKLDENMYLRGNKISNQMEFYQPYKKMAKDQLHSQSTKTLPISKQSYEDFKIIEKTMVLNYIDNSNRKKNIENRLFTTGEQDHAVKVSLNNYVHDLIQNRLVSPHLVKYWPYDMDTEENLERSLTEEEVEKRRSGELDNIAFPRQPCGVPFLQGWDSLALEIMRMAGVPIAMFAPTLSLPQKLFLSDIFRDKENIIYSKKETPNTLMKRVLIISIENNIYGNKKNFREIIVRIGKEKKILYFAKTQELAKNIYQCLSSCIETVYYDGVEHNRCGLPKSDSEYYRVYCSYCYGPLGQGINFFHPVVMVDTNTEKPKHVNTGSLIYREPDEQNLDDIIALSNQCAGRIMRPQEGVENDEDTPRVIIYFGKNAADVARSSVQFFGSVGHNVKHLDCGKDNNELMEKATMRFTTRQDISDLEKEAAFIAKIQDDPIAFAKHKISKSVNAAREMDQTFIPSWDSVRRNASVSFLDSESKKQIRDWMREEFVHPKGKEKTDA